MARSIAHEFHEDVGTREVEGSGSCREEVVIHMVRTVLEVLFVFAVSVTFSMVVLQLIHIIPSINSHKASGLAVVVARLSENGIVLIGVGVLYVVAGFVLARLVHRVAIR